MSHGLNVTKGLTEVVQPLDDAAQFAMGTRYRADAQHTGMYFHSPMVNAPEGIERGQAFYRVF